MEEEDIFIKKKGEIYKIKRVHKIGITYKKM